jgi:hypothetical protein
MTDTELLNIDGVYFKVEKILYNTEDFAISHGTFLGEDKKYIGMLWKKKTDYQGYPNSKKRNQQWFCLKNNFDTAILLSLIGKEGTVEENVIGLIKR